MSNTINTTQPPWSQIILNILGLNSSSEFQQASYLYQCLYIFNVLWVLSRQIIQFLRSSIQIRPASCHDEGLKREKLCRNYWTMPEQCAINNIRFKYILLFVDEYIHSAKYSLNNSMLIYSLKHILHSEILRPTNFNAI